MQPQLVLVGKGLRKVLDVSYNEMGECKDNPFTCWSMLLGKLDKYVSKLEKGEFPQDFEEQHLQNGS